MNPLAVLASWRSTKFAPLSLPENATDIKRDFEAGGMQPGDGEVARLWAGMWGDQSPGGGMWTLDWESDKIKVWSATPPVEGSPEGTPRDMGAAQQRPQ